MEFNELQNPSEDVATEKTEEQSAASQKNVKFTLTTPANLEEVLANVCCKRGRKLIFSPKEIIFDGTFTVLGTDKKNEEGIKVKDILDAEIKEGVRLGYLDKFDGLKSSEIKEEYENDVVYEFADQEFKKTGLLYDGKTIKVYLFDWTGSVCHHVGYIDGEAAKGLIPYLENKDEYSFGICGIITGGKGKRVEKDESGKLVIVKEKNGDIGLELDVSVLNRKD